MSRKIVESNGEEIVLTVIQYRCPECGEIYEQGYVKAAFWPIQDGGMCPKCKEILSHFEKTEVINHIDGKKTTLTTLNYPVFITIKGKIPSHHYTYYIGACEVCKQFPCKHAYQDENDYFAWKLMKEEVKQK